VRAENPERGTIMQLMCAKCKVQACDQPSDSRKLPAYCPMVETAEAENTLVQCEVAYRDEGPRRQLALAAARTEAAGYLRWPRVQEVMEFAWRIGAGHLGIASCIGLIEEARILQGILEENGFLVSSVCCKVGGIPKGDVGLRPEETLKPEGGYDPLCNPIGQAELLNLAGTELNVLVGLCVGHDSLFLMHSKAPSTVLVAKDRVTGHNPVVALYASNSYFSRLKDVSHDRS
jgi:uncharacterized metal-binding protein